MPTYTFRCSECGNTKEAYSSISELDRLKSTMYHCDTLMGKIITAGRGFFERSAFDSSEIFEHCGDDPRAFRDKYEMQDHCDEFEVRSAYLEDGDIPK